MKQPPSRTGVTDLTDDQLLLFDFFWDCWIPRRFLDSESYSMHMNVPYTHNLDGEQLELVLKQLVERELICSRESSPDAFTLTARGGALWEAERQPDWERYISIRGSYNQQRLYVVAIDETMGRHYIGALFSAGFIVPTDKIKCRTIGNHWLTPWKRVPVAELLRVRIRGEEPMGSGDWAVYQSGRNWWCSISELDSLKPNGIAHPGVQSLISPPGTSRHFPAKPGTSKTMHHDPVPLDSTRRPEWHGSQEFPDIERWKQTPPSADEFARFADELGCSDCVFDTFFWLIPHLLDIIEKCGDQEVRNSLFDSFAFRFVQAVENDHSDESLSRKLHTSIPRVKKLTLEWLETEPAGRHLHLATLAACYWQHEMAIYISRFDDTA